MTYTPEQMLVEADYWAAKAERIKERCRNNITTRTDASDLAHAENADILLRHGADAVERVRELEYAISDAGLYVLKPASGDPCVLVALNPAPKETK